MNIYRRIIYNSQKTGTNPNIYQLRTGKIWSIQLCDHKGYSPSGSSVHGILQERKLEWGAIPFSRRSSRPKDQTWVS